MRVLHIIPYFYPAWAYGGTCRAAWELARQLAGQGIKQTVLTTDALDSQQRAEPRHEVVDGVEIVRLPNLSNALAWRRVFLPRGFRSALAGQLPQADVVHIHEYRSVLNALALRQLQQASKPLVLTPQGSLPMLVSRFAAKRVYDALVGRPTLALTSRFHALNPMERDQFVALGADPARVVVRPNGIDLAEFETLPERSDFRAAHDIPAEAPLVLFLARLHRIKGADFLIEAFARLVKTRSDAVLALVGPDDGVEVELRQQVAALGLEKQVVFAGFTSGRAKLEAYLAADIYVLPSRYEILGITLLEALACGTPVIATAQCGLGHDIASNELGHIVEFGDVDALADLLLRLTDAPITPESATRRRAWVLENFGWATIAARWLPVYRELAGIAEPPTDEHKTPPAPVEPASDEQPAPDADNAAPDELDDERDNAASDD